MKKLLSLRNNFKYVAWFFWCFFIFNSLVDLCFPLIIPKQDIHIVDHIRLIISSLAVVALIEAGITVLLRYFALIRPAKKGTYHPHGGPFRFLIVSLVNWAFAESIAIYGAVTYYMSGQVWPTLLFGGIGLVLLLFHSPRLKPFDMEPSTGPDAVDASFPGTA